jgi:hypothetical protein
MSHDCKRIALVGTDRYRCQAHEDGFHCYAAHWPACPAPFCKLPPGHRGLHDIPSGDVEYTDTEPVTPRAVAARGSAGEVP